MRSRHCTPGRSSARVPFEQGMPHAERRTARDPGWIRCGRRAAGGLLLLVLVSCAQQVGYLVGGDSRAEALSGVWKVHDAPEAIPAEELALIVSRRDAVALVGDERIIDTTGEWLIASGGLMFGMRAGAPESLYVFVTQQRPWSETGEILALYRAEFADTLPGPAEDLRHSGWTYLGLWQVEESLEEDGARNRLLHWTGPAGERLTCTHDRRGTQLLQEGGVPLVAATPHAEGLAIAGSGPVEAGQELAPSGGWDTPPAATCLGRSERWAAGELLLLLRDWADRDRVEAIVEAQGQRVLGEVPDARVMKISVPRWEEFESMSAFLGHAEILSVQPNYCWVVSGSYAASSHYTPDRSLGRRWHLENAGGPSMAVEDAWQLQRGSADVVVAVIDLGFRLDHPALAGRLLPGHDYVDEDSDPSSFLDHGTAVAGLIAANEGNDLCVAGVDQTCKLLPLRAHGPTQTFDFDMVQAIAHATRARADVVLMAASCPDPGTQHAMVDEALRLASEAGCILVASAGIGPRNTAAADSQFPGKSPWTISIGATNARDRRLLHSATGNTLDFVAPGDNVSTLGASLALEEPLLFSGTSASAALAAGLCALLVAQHPDLSQDQVYELLRLGAEDQLGDSQQDMPGWDPTYGHGRLNAARSLVAAARLGAPGRPLEPLAMGAMGGD